MQDFTSKSDNELYFEMDEEDVPKLNKYLVLKDIAVKAFVPMRSLEEYFLNITEGVE